MTSVSAFPFVWLVPSEVDSLSPAVFVSDVPTVSLVPLVSVTEFVVVVDVPLVLVFDRFVVFPSLDPVEVLVPSVTIKLICIFAKGDI